MGQKMSISVAKKRARRFFGRTKPLTFNMLALIFIATRRSEGRSDSVASRPRGLLLADFPFGKGMVCLEITLAVARRESSLFLN